MTRVYRVKMTRAVKALKQLDQKAWRDCQLGPNRSSYPKPIRKQIHTLRRRGEAYFGGKLDYPKPPAGPRIRSRS